MPTEKITGIPFLVILFRTFKHIRSPELLKIVKESIVLLKEMRLDLDTLEFFEAYVRYLEAAAPKDKIEEIRNVIDKVLMKDSGAMSELLRKIYGDLYRKSIEDAEKKKEREVEKYKQEAELERKKLEKKIQEMKTEAMLMHEMLEKEIQQRDESKGEITRERDNLKKKNEDIIKNMLTAKIDETTIANVTGLPIDTIRKMGGGTN
jgi:flagellar biosynthesis GTPase FlhF